MMNISFSATRLILILIPGLMLMGCFGQAVQPTVHELTGEGADAERSGNIVLTRRVFLARGEEHKHFYFAERSVDVTATSKFGKEHEIADVGCIAAGLQEVLDNPIIITPAVFWESVGNDKNTLSLLSLFDEPYAEAAETLDLDFLIVAYHQLFDVESVFMEAIIEGVFKDEDREVAATLTVNMNNKRVIDAFEVDAHHKKIVAHMTVIPLSKSEYPEDCPCRVAGQRAAEGISRSHTSNKPPRIAIVAATSNPYSAISALTP